MRSEIGSMRVRRVVGRTTGGRGSIPSRLLFVCHWQQFWAASVLSAALAELRAVNAIGEEEDSSPLRHGEHGEEMAEMIF